MTGAGDTTLERELSAVMRELAVARPPAPPQSPDPTRARIDAALATGTAPPRLGRFIVLELLGEGGMGVVYAAYDPELDRRIAVKLLRRDVGQAADRLLREARAMAKLSHPNVASVYEAGTDGDAVFLAMELVQGQTLRAWATARERTQGELLGAYLQAGRGLAAAHAAGLVHRDFKPENAVLGRDDRVRVLDFGLARPHHTEDASGHGDASTPRPLDDEAATRTGVIAGTPAYMSPEQINGERVDARSDQFAYCVAVYEALTGRRPFTAPSSAERLTQMRRGELPAGTREDIPRHIRAALVRGLAAEPGQRWPDMDALLAELALDPTRARRRRGIAVGASAVLALGVGGFVLHRAQLARACADEGQRIAEVWNDDARARIGDALLGSGFGNAADTWQRLEPVLDEHAQHWSEASEVVCVSSRIDGTRSPALAQLAEDCLDDAREELAARIELFAAPDAMVVAQALPLAHRLPSIDACTDDAALLQRPARPEDPELRGTVVELSRRLIHNELLADTERTTAGLANAQALVEETTDARLAAQHATALVQVGVFAAVLGDSATSRHALERGISLAMTSGAEHVAIRGAIAVMRAGGTRAAHERGLWWGWLARTLLDRLQVDNPALRLELLSALIRAHQELRDYAAQQVLLDEALALAERVYGTEHASFAGVLQQLGALHVNQRQYDKGVVELQRAIDLLSAALGPGHPEVAHAQAGLAFAYLHRGRYDEARALGEHALAIYESALGPTHFRAASVVQLLAQVHIGRSDFAQAEPLLERALQLAAAATPERAGPLTANALSSRGHAMARRGRYAEAEQDYERAVAAYETAYGHDDPRLGTALTHLAESIREQGRGSEALPVYLRAQQILERYGDGRGQEMLLLGIGEIYLEQKDAAQAHKYFERAAAMCKRRNGEPTMRALIGTALARSSAAQHADQATIRGFVASATTWAKQCAPAEQEQLLADLKVVADTHLR